MKALVALAWLALAPAAFAQSEADDQALAAVEACIARLDPAVDVGYERIARRCPDLARSLERSGWAAWLPPGWKESRNDLSAGSLEELKTLAARELATPVPAHRPSVKRLDEVLAGLGQRTEERGGLWARFKQWVRTLFEQSERADDEGWLDRMVSRVGLSQTLVEIVTYVSLALIVILAALIVANELRAAGWLGFSRKPPSSRASPHQAFQAGSPVTWRDVERAPLRDKPGLLLELIASRLTQLERLPPAASLTVREMTSAARLEDEDRRRLAELALAAERARYAPDASASALESGIQQGRELLQRLELSSASASA